MTVVRRWALPKGPSDRVALAVFSVGGIYLLWYELYIVLGTYQQEQKTPVTLHYAIAAFLAVNIYGNMFELITSDVAGSGSIFPSGPPLKGWRYCPVCVRNLPPRSHHCIKCNVCILKRDHHCWFAGYCIGYHNHRYYVALVIHIVIAAVYCDILNFSFVSSVKGEIGVWNMLSFLAPHVGWILGYCSGYTAFVTFMTTTGYLLTFLFLWLLYIQVVQIFGGQSRYERKKGIKRYHLGWKQNLIEVCGKNWYIIVLCPWLPSPLVGDGTEFREHVTKDI